MHKLEYQRGRRPTVVPEEFHAAFEEYTKNIAADGPLDKKTVRVYCSRVRQFLAWLGETGVTGERLTDPDVRDRAILGYRSYLLTVKNQKPSTVKAYVVAIDDFFRERTPGRAIRRRRNLTDIASGGLSDRTRALWLYATERAPARGKALACTVYYAGLRGNEVVALDVADVCPFADEGVLFVRSGRDRVIPLHPRLRAALDDWLAERATWPGADENPALFLNRRGGRLSLRSVYNELKAIAESAGLELGRIGRLVRPQDD
ncbi:tyrosine-type recombinase/integrase [Amycolatopsis sp. lyj-90]|uniref:tyrosine-type recombinase/integrase n=1 Tax=Amycolatopsis sp. lyj-90 TaxID=2789285 RepID=UPI00397E10CC